MGGWVINSHYYQVNMQLLCNFVCLQVIKVNKPAMALQWDKLSPAEFQQLQDFAGCKYNEFIPLTNVILQVVLLLMLSTYVENMRKILCKITQYFAQINGTL